MSTRPITSPDDPALAELCQLLRQAAVETDLSGEWPARQLELCGEFGVYEWFVDPAWGGQAWDEESVTRGYLALAGACLTTTFILTQRTGACRRIAGSSSDYLKSLLLPDLARGTAFATVGISHLTTSRRHLAQPVLRAHRSAGGFVLDGFSPWVTGAVCAEHVVVGATLMDGDQPTDEQLLAVVPTDLPGVDVPAPSQLVGVSASCTGQLTFDRVELDKRWILDGPVANVMSQGTGAGTGGTQTSTLALGLAQAAIRFLADEAIKRDELSAPRDALRNELDEVCDLLFATLRGEPDCEAEQLRQRANSLALRATQASLVAAKGTGYVLGHPAGRWCREALFFLVWSCPQPVVSANLCELAGIVE